MAEMDWTGTKMLGLYTVTDVAANLLWRLSCCLVVTVERLRFLGGTDGLAAVRGFDAFAAVRGFDGVRGSLEVPAEATSIWLDVAVSGEAA